MSYTVLARKWRPQKFEDVVGQRHVTQSLVNALNMNRVAHAFLFSGTRGVGKTTTARILARALNCDKGPTATPCGECDSCREIASGTSVDVIEIDAASNTSVENIRELNENVKYAPARGRYKVYIIDEVHMLSNSAFNALLKTLEEPPAHVVFVFATTDPHKLPATILSRCQHYDFRRVPRAQIEAHLKGICDAESIKAEPKALSRLAGLAEGSVRDGLSLLDQVLAFCGEEGIREQDIDDILGLVGREVVLEAARAITAQEPVSALDVVSGLVDKGHDLRRFAAELLGFFRDLLVCRITPTPERAVDAGGSGLEEIKAMSKALSPEEIIRVMNLLARLADELKWSAAPRISLELALVKAASRPIAGIDEILAGVKSAKGGQPAPAAPATERKPAGRVRDASAYYEYAPDIASRPAGEQSAVDIWDQVRGEIKKMPNKAPLASKMKVAAPKSIEGNVLTVAEGYPPFKQEEIALINEAASQIGVGITVKFSKEKGATKTLAEVKQEREKTRHDKIKDEAMNDPLVKSALDLFGGELVDVDEEKTGT
jgi:DNA polymerase-3 subunit gamma/tau